MYFRFVICWASCRAAAPQLESGAGGCAGEEGARAWRRRAAAAGAAALPLARAALALLHAPAARRAVAFPHPRLLQYDCGGFRRLYL